MPCFFRVITTRSPENHRNAEWTEVGCFWEEAEENDSVPPDCRSDGGVLLTGIRVMDAARLRALLTALDTVATTMSTCYVLPRAGVYCDRQSLLVCAAAASASAAESSSSVVDCHLEHGLYVDDGDGALAALEGRPLLHPGAPLLCFTRPAGQACLHETRLAQLAARADNALTDPVVGPWLRDHQTKMPAVVDKGPTLKKQRKRRS